MRKLFFVSALLLLLPSLTLDAQVEFLEVVTRKDLDEARQKAADGMQMLFVDIYATWCGPCKKMDSEVYPDPELSAFLNEHFVSVRMDGETPFGRDYAAELKLQGYPSVFIFGTEGELVSSIVGYKPAATLLASLKSMQRSYAGLKRYRRQHEAGELDKPGLAGYISLLREMGNEEEAGKLAVDYARLAPEGGLTDDDLRIIVPFMDLGDEIWTRVKADKALLSNTFGPEYVPVLQGIYDRSMRKAIDEEDIELVSRISHELMPMLEVAMVTEADMKSMPFIHFYYFTGQTDKLGKYIDERWAADKKDDHSWLFNAASQVIDMDQRTQTPGLMKKGEEWLSACIALEPKFDYYFYHAISLIFQDRIEEGRVSLDKAGELAETPEQHGMINQVLQFIGQQ